MNFVPLISALQTLPRVLCCAHKPTAQPTRVAGSNEAVLAAAAVALDAHAASGVSGVEAQDGGVPVDQVALEGGGAGRGQTVGGKHTVCMERDTDRREAWDALSP